jgi:hypothetical protein
MMRKLIIFAIAAGVAACSTTQKAPEPDTSPTNPTAVIETHVNNGGVLGIASFESTEKHYVRTNMRREDNTTKGIGTFGAITSFFLGHESSNIERLDRNVRWTLNNSKKEYTECPVHGCRLPPKKEKPAEEQKSEPKAKTESGCTMKIAKTSFNVNAMDEKQEINGFKSDKYKVAWVVTMQDNTKRTTTSTLNIDVWTTPLTAEMRKALGVEETFDKAYAASAPQAQRVAARKSSEVMPQEVAKMMQAYLSSGLSASDRDALVRAGRELEKIKGHPISTHLEWSMEGNACAAKDAASASTGPILSFTVEVKTLKVEPAHDSLFSVPKDYKLVSQP